MTAVYSCSSDDGDKFKSGKHGQKRVQETQESEPGWPRTYAIAQSCAWKSKQPSLASLKRTQSMGVAAKALSTALYAADSNFATGSVLCGITDMMPVLYVCS
jgi:hypothetical protein